jgi:UDP-N-acetyl-2-amino-2-deoxyglucuronate dehydrogenase
MSQIRFGIVGCGNIAATHWNGVKTSANAVLTAVCDSVESKATKLGNDAGVPSFQDYNAFLNEVDAVLICLPSGLHCDFTVQAARKGKHVLTEKPIDITLKNAITMVEVCEEAGVHLGCISQHRCAGDIRKLQKAIADGELGTMIEGDAYIKWYRSQAYYDSAGWRGTWEMDGGGCLMNQGVHYIDMIQWIMGGVKSVQARTRTAMHNIEVEDQAMAIVEYHNGALGVIQGSTATYPGITERLEVHGTKGSVIVESDRAKIWVSKETSEHEAFGATVTLGKAHELADDPTATWNTQHQFQIEDFAHAILEKRAPFISGREALEPLKVILGIYESSRRGGEKVELTELQA